MTSQRRPINLFLVLHFSNLAFPWPFRNTPGDKLAAGGIQAPSKRDMASDDVVAGDGKSRNGEEQGPERTTQARFSPEEEKV